MKPTTKTILYLLLLPIPLLVIVYFLWPRPTQVIYDHEHPKLVELYNDAYNGGNSEGSVQKGQSSLVFSYTVGNKIQFPYSGYRLLNLDSSEYDLNPFNKITISIKADKARHIPINLGTQNYPLKNGQRATLIHHTQLDYQPDKKEYTIAFKEFAIPMWWFSIHHIDERDLTERDFSKVTSIDMQGGELVKPMESDTIELFSMKLSYDPTEMFLEIGMYVLILNVLALLVFLFRLKYRVQIVPVPYSKQEVENIAENDIDRIQQFVSENYHNTITTQSVQHGTGIPKSRIPSLIKEELNTTLKQLVTSIRINEAKRHLKNSDIPVNEVALQVGFGNVSHFNRVFKEFEKMTPLDYRKS